MHLSKLFGFDETLPSTIAGRQIATDFTSAGPQKVDYVGIVPKSFTYYIPIQKFES